MKTPLKITGKTCDGRFLIGGVWKLYHQDGVPLDMSYDIISSQGYLVDWLEVMLSASVDNNLPALMKKLENILDRSTILSLELKFQEYINQKGTNYNQLIKDKNENI